ncbi:MAG TPA: PPK2 family polyphosphate kinase [Acidimicrobiales bacterium]|nr:PPK2 family polyphosphate kinase [Acidimicrobiales bacterium]
MTGADDGLDRWLVHPGHEPHLSHRDPGSTAGAPGDRAVTDSAAAGHIARLSDLQDRLWAENRRSLLLVLQGMDSAGKDGTIKHVFRGVNPQGVRVTSFKEPAPEELAHDFLWRVHHHVPRAGEIVIFNRSHYEDVLVPLVHQAVPSPRVEVRRGAIVAFEDLLGDAGTEVVKVFLHLSPDEQARRLESRLTEPDKRWKTGASDFAERALWDRYHDAYERAIERTTTERAPWYVVPADHKWYRNWVVGEILVRTLEKMDPRYPQLSDVELRSRAQDAHRPGPPKGRVDG